MTEEIKNEAIEEAPTKLAEEEVAEESKENSEEKSDEKKKSAKPSSGKINETKLKKVNELADKLKNSKTVMVISIRGVPSPQMQKIKKDLRGKAEVKVVKKNILERAIDATGIPEMEELKQHVKADCAIGLSGDDAFEIAGLLSGMRSPIAAKAGQEAPENINIEPGPTDLMPGPDISALGNVGLQVAVEEGKIAIKAPHTILKEGDVVTEDIASVLLKLDIKPFMIGLNPTVLYDSESKKVYVGVKIDKDEALNNLLLGKSKGLGFAQSLELITSDTIGYLLAKANSHANALEKLSPTEAPVKEENASSNVPSEEGKEVTEENKEEESEEEAPVEKAKDDTETKSEEEQK